VTIRQIRLIFFGISLVLIFITSCKKLNEATELGGGVIPGVDGVNTFEEILPVEAYNSIFDPAKDSVYIGAASDHILGSITNDPFVGKTDATIFLQLKPEIFPYTFVSGIKKDSLVIDSVVMVLGWTGNWGDTNIRQHVSVYEMDQSNIFRADSFYLVRNRSFTYTNLLGSKDFFPHELNDSVFAFQDTTAGQLRIKLDALTNNFGRRLLNYDSTDAYKTDSAFSTYVKGFAIVPDVNQGNALMSFAIYNNPKTKLAIYYHYPKDGQTIKTVSYFGFTASSAQHNYIHREFSGSSLAQASGTTTEDPLIYLLNTPGSYATVKIPGLRNMSNRVINRAEFIVEEVYDPTDKIFTPPEGILLDVYDSTLSDYKYVPYDFVPDNSGSGLVTFGVYGENAVDGFGNLIRVWKFPITRYVQNILTKKEPLHDFRLSAVKTAYQRVRTGYLNNTGDYTYFGATINTQYAIGRVRVAGGNHPSTQRMRLRIIYTKI
jgi:hypothetical protein